jgi:hypothetical protein
MIEATLSFGLEKEELTEMLDWCEQFCKGVWTYIPSHHREEPVVEDAAPNPGFGQGWRTVKTVTIYPPSIIFHDDSDGMHFKLVWG